MPGSTAVCGDLDLPELQGTGLGTWLPLAQDSSLAKPLAQAGKEHYHIFLGFL